VATAVTLAELDRLIARGAQVVEVLPDDQYAEGHVPGALGLPLKRLTREAAEHLDRDRPVVVYCWDALCDLSPRAAAWLEELGFEEVYDYVAGKVDWLVNRRPVQGDRTPGATVGELARDDVARCRPGDRVGEVREQVERSPYPFALVLSVGGVVLGRLRRSRLACDPELLAADVMEPGPSTVRPHKTAAGVAQDLAQGDLRWAIVTTALGELIGIAARADLERRGG